jgi:hypothetical protein
LIHPIVENLLIIDKLSKSDLEILLSDGSITCEGQPITLDRFREEGTLKEPYRTALVLKVMGKTTGALLCALSLIDGEDGSYGRRIGQLLSKDDNYIRQLLHLLEHMGILSSSTGKGKQRIFTLERDVLILPKGQLDNVLKGKPFCSKTLTVREIQEGTLSVEDLFTCLYDHQINQIIHPSGEKEKFEIGQLIESMIKSGITRTLETSSSKRLRPEEFLTFYQLLALLDRVRRRVPLDTQGNVSSADLTRIIGEELHMKDPTGNLSKKYQDYVQYRLRKQIVTAEGIASIDFSTLKDLIDSISTQKGINLSSKMRNLIAEDIISSLKGLPITSFKESFITGFVDNWLEDRFLITSSEEMMNQVETLLRVGKRLVENAKDIQPLDEEKATEFATGASLNVLSVLLLMAGEIPPQKRTLMKKAFSKKKGDQSIFGHIVENFSSVRKDNTFKLMSEFQETKKILEGKFQAFDVARFLRNYIKMVTSYTQEKELVDFIETTEAVWHIGHLLYQYRMHQFAG